MNEQVLSGKVALVTGGSRGIGAATARRLARLGADVVLTYVEQAAKAEAVAEELRSAGVRAEAVRADQADRDQVTATVDGVAARFGRIDVLVNSAGVFRAGALSPGDRDLQATINVNGLADTTYAALPHLSDGGRVINLSSALGSRAGTPGVADYAATKAAVSAYARAWAQDLAPRRITVNVIECGVIDTDMAVPADSEMGRAFLQMIPLRRYATADEVGAVVAFLAGPDAGYITGTTLRIDGGAMA
ncbi:SDR family NAD(P)-dependent oxidoreductase [Actinoplanes sp. RD1]|uniref:SDR family NAD(P)-dependent oxidoreductase n=1 Tax=Actinoplanes sp. RD1 TaxID=3064538 RepID=UPI002740C894|nr:SDR family oxidoreductase [Actinoplanes sp. RD1]